MNLAGLFQHFSIIKIVDQGAYLRVESEEILLPKRFLPAHAKTGDTVEAFIYHDSEGRLIATTQKPYALPGEIAFMKTISKAPHGYYMDWGLMKDLLVPNSQTKDKMIIQKKYPILVFIDEKTGRMAGTQHYGHLLRNEDITVKEGDEVHLLIHRTTEIGYEVIINHHLVGLLHHQDCYKNYSLGDAIIGFIKKIRSDLKIDVMPGRKGYARLDDNTQILVEKLIKEGGYLPLNDHSDPAIIASTLGMSKKVFKMTLGHLYKSGRITIIEKGIKWKS